MTGRRSNDAESHGLLIRGGRIYTMDDANPIAEAVLVHDGRVVAVGARRDVERMARPGTATVDLDGAFAVPGLLDTHPHLLHYGTLEAPLVPIWDCRDHDEIVAALTERVGQLPPGEWLQATPVGEPHYFFRRSYRDLNEGILPDRRVLDRVSTQHPIAIQAWAPVRPSCMAFNSMALHRLGITRETPERVGNVWIEKDATGEPTGLVTGSVINYYGFDAFGDQMWRGMPFLNLEQLVPGTATAIETYHRQGVTGVYENHMMEPILIDAYRQLRREDKLKMRVLVSQEAESYGLPWSEPRGIQDFTALLEQAAGSIDLEDALLRFNGFTIMWDGYCFGGAQMMRSPYLDVYGRVTRGHRHITAEKAEYVVRFCAERRIRLNVLVMGTQAHDEMLGLLEGVAAECDISALNWVLVHATTIEPEQVARYRQLNFSCTTSMTFCWGEGDLIRRSMGSRVLKDLVPLRCFLDAGMAVGGGTDWGPKNPWEQLQLSLTHEFGESGYRNLGAHQRISRGEALAMLTRDAARVMRWNDIGAIAPGRHADIAIIDRDPIECPVDTLKDTRVLRTLFAGAAVYDSGHLS
jgi:predicted amidohydrolase YtcJ